MTNLSVETMVARVIELLSDPRVCRLGENALRQQFRRALRDANNPHDPVPDEAIDHVSGQVANHAGDLCRQLSPEARAIATATVVAGVVYGVTRMPEQQIRDIIARAQPRIRTDLGFLGAPDVELSVAPSLGPLVGRDPHVEFRVRRQWDQQEANLSFDTDGRVGLGYSASEGNAQWGASVSREPGGAVEGRVYFSIRW